MNDILFGNNNKAVIKKLANRSFRSNKMRNVIAVIAIALTTFLFTAVLTIGMGASGTLEYSMAKLMGSSADALVQGLSEEQFQQLKQNAMFEKVGCWIPIDIMTNTNRRVAEVDYADQAQLEIRMLTPRTGSAPQKANEVLVSANILKDLNIEEKIGAEIPIELKARQSGQIYHFDMVVSGIYDTPNEKSESVIVSKAFLEENAEMMSDIAQGRVGCGIYTSDVVMRDNYMVKDRISELVRNIGGNPDDVNAANAVRVAPNPIVSNDSGLMMWLVAGVFGILFFDFFCRLFWNSAVMPKVISKRRLNAWTIYYKITSGLVFDIGIFVKTATHYEHRIQKDNAQSQRNHNKDRPALIALKIGLRHTGNNCSGICLFSFYGNGILLYIADSLDR
jgi:putative ABC transport system permease protein